jgi:hypothetical protein
MAISYTKIVFRNTEFRAAVMVENPDSEAAKLINLCVASICSGRRSPKAGKGFADVLDFRYV